MVTGRVMFSRTCHLRLSHHVFPHFQLVFSLIKNTVNSLKVTTSRKEKWLFRCFLLNFPFVFVQTNKTQLSKADRLNYLDRGCFSDVQTTSYPHCGTGLDLMDTPFGLSFYKGTTTWIFIDSIALRLLCKMITLLLFITSNDVIWSAILNPTSKGQETWTEIIAKSSQDV